MPVRSVNGLTMARNDACSSPPHVARTCRRRLVVDCWLPPAHAESATARSSARGRPFISALGRTRPNMNSSSLWAVDGGAARECVPRPYRASQALSTIKQKSGGNHGSSFRSQGKKKLSLPQGRGRESRGKHCRSGGGRLRVGMGAAERGHGRGATVPRSSTATARRHRERSPYLPSPQPVPRSRPLTVRIVSL